MVLNPGQVLQNGKYTIERELGRGRFGITHLAKQADGKRWVIKILNPDVLTTLSPDERSRLETMFWQEAVKLAKCNGTPHIVQTEMPFKEGDIVYLPMEYMDGNSLADRAQPQLLETNGLEYIRQIGDALTVVHGKGLVHCDIRPANIFLRLRGNTVESVLTGFGLALSCDAELTRTRTKELSDGFSPIELYSRGKPVGPYTDVYSLAATLYELLTGTVPVSADDRGIQDDKLVSPQVKNPEISGKTTKAILAAMALMPEKRPKSVKKWLQQLDLSQIKSGTQTPKEINWAKWAVIWAIIIPGLGLIVAIFAMIPSWLPVLRPEGQAQPQVKPAASASPK
jgi:eukaryotic-like serine/threonine-protein kinase